MFTFDYNLPPLERLAQLKVSPLHVRDQLEIMIVESYNTIVRHSIMERIHQRGLLGSGSIQKMHDQMLAAAKLGKKQAEETLKNLLEFHEEELKRIAAIPKEPLDKPTKGAIIEP